MTAYLDNSATTRVREEAVREVVRVMSEDYGNPSSQHAVGRSANKTLAAARAKLAAAIGAMPDEIFFTSGGTEADDWACFSGVQANRRVGKHIISTAVEHDAILKSLAELERRGYEVTYLKPDRSGRISIGDFETALREDTCLVTVMLVNNETGAVMPIHELSEIIKRRGSHALLHTDAVQGFLKLPVSVKSLGADMMTMSSHKIHGPKGVGALYVRKGLRLPPYIYGGGQEGGLRSGTEALPAIAGFAAAAEAGARTLAEDIEKMHSMRESLAERITAEIPGSVIIGGGAPHILCVALPKYRSEVLLNYLDAKGVCVSRGSACKKGRRSHVLTAMGLSNDIIDGSIRISLSHETTPEEIEYAADCLKSASEELFTSL